MMLSNVKLATTLSACLAILVLSTAARPTRADDAKPTPQFVYKTIGQRQLTADVLYPEVWRASDKRPSMVFFSGGGWRSGGTSQFRPQAEYFAKRGLVTVRAEYRDSTSHLIK